MKDHLTKVDDMIISMEEVGLKLERTWKIAVLLACLGDEYDLVIATIDLNDDDITIETVKERLVEASFKLDCKPLRIYWTEEDVQNTEKGSSSKDSANVAISS